MSKETVKQASPRREALAIVLAGLTKRAERGLLPMARMGAKYPAASAKAKAKRPSSSKPPAAKSAMLRKVASALQSRQLMRKLAYAVFKHGDTLLQSKSAAERTGLARSYAAALLPDTELLTKAASHYGVEVEAVKQAFLEKHAILPWLAGGAALGLGIPAIGHLVKSLGPAIDPYGHGLGTDEDRAFAKKVQAEQTRNLRLSQQLQAMRGAFAPAPNPHGGPSLPPNYVGAH